MDGGLPPDPLPVVIAMVDEGPRVLRAPRLRRWRQCGLLLDGDGLELDGARLYLDAGTVFQLWLVR
jgi:hypothetical protein